MFVCLPYSAYSNTPDESLEVVMKEMALSYKHAKKAESLTILHNHLNDLEILLKKSKSIGFKNEVDKSNEGINKVLTLINEIKQYKDLTKAKQTLNKIDKVRKHYHKLHEPSFWQLLFGK